jgi:hypothetical protein
MKEAEAQNALLVGLLSRRLRLEVETAQDLIDLALLSTPGLAADSSFGGSGVRPAGAAATAAGAAAAAAGGGSAIAIDERARIASLAATASATADLSPGRVLAVLGAEQATEGLRRRRVALACTDALLKERLEPMAKDFHSVVAATHASGGGLLQGCRGVHGQVRELFDKYDAVNRALVKEFADPTVAQNAAAMVFTSSNQIQTQSSQAAGTAATVESAGGTTNDNNANNEGGRTTAITADERRLANAVAAAEAVRISEALKASAPSSVTAAADSASLLSSFQLVPCSATPEEGDAWLCELQWRTAVGWQGSLFREATRRFRAK